MVFNIVPFDQAKELRRLIGGANAKAFRGGSEVAITAIKMLGLRNTFIQEK